MRGFESFRFALGAAVGGCTKASVKDPPIHFGRRVQAENPRNRRGQVQVATGQVVSETGAKIRAGGDQHIVQVKRTQGTVRSFIVPAAVAGNLARRPEFIA